MGFRKNVQTIVKTFRFAPELVEDMERVLFLTTAGEKPKYRSMTKLVMTAISDLIKRERKVLEDKGIAWEHLGEDFRDSTKEKQ